MGSQKSSGTGTVKFFNKEKGFGFITQDSGSDIFFHDSKVLFDSIDKGDKVKFDIEEGKKGPMATNVAQV